MVSSSSALTTMSQEDPNQNTVEPSQFHSPDPKLCAPFHRRLHYTGTFLRNNE